MKYVSILSVKQQIDRKGVFYKVLLTLDGKLVTCFLRSEMGRGELLQRLCTITSLDDLYHIDRRAVLYSA